MLSSADLLPPAAPPAPTTLHTVLRAICLAGKRVEIGAAVLLSAAQSGELMAAGKVARLVGPEPAADLAAKPASARKLRPNAPV